MPEKQQEHSGACHDRCSTLRLNYFLNDEAPLTQNVRNQVMLHGMFFLVFQGRGMFHPVAVFFFL